MKYATLFFVSLLFFAHSAWGGGSLRESLCKVRFEKGPQILTGNLSTDLFAGRKPWTLREEKQVMNLFENQTESTDRKSPILAGVLSAAIPGAGEFYSESYVKSGVFFAAEVISWVVNVSYNRRGDRATDDFQNFADANWSVVDYATWINQNGHNFNPNVTCNITIDPNTSLSLWKRVNWAELNECERKLGGLFSHTLPVYGDQQYFELIGKYPQYNPGWKDADRSHISEDNISALFKSYSQMRGHANDLYNKASTALLVIVVNHILSAADAAWSASRYNAVHTELGMKMQRTPFGVEAVPTASLQVRW